MVKKKLLVSVSGGETSEFMAQWLWKHKRDEYDMLFVFANTGQENEETLEFVQQCSQYFGFPVVWVECLVNPTFGIGTTYKVVDFNTASRNGEPFESYISKYGIPNQANPQCTRELKQAPITSYARQYFGTSDYETAIGIRSDEIDRMSVKRKQRKLVYPLISKAFLPGITKPVINLFWSQMSFRLKLKGYQGNCKWCWKKSRPKLLRIAKDNPEFFDFPAAIEQKYGNYFPTHRLEKWLKLGKAIPSNITFFRGNTSALQILSAAKMANPVIVDDSSQYNTQSTLQMDDSDIDLIGGESCEVFSECES
jgi:hypothetical protein